MTRKKFMTVALATALTTALIPANASAAEVSGQMIEHKGKMVAACEVTLTAAEKQEISTRAEAYATERAAFGNAIIPVIAQKAGVSTDELTALLNHKKVDKKKLEEIAAKASLKPNELFALLLWGMDRDGDRYAEKYVKKYSKVQTTEDWAKERSARIKLYEKALTDATARVEVFELEGKVSDSFTQIIASAAGQLTKAIAATYNLKVIGTDLNNACLAAIRDHKPATVTIPAVKVATAIDSSQYKEATKKVSQENELKENQLSSDISAQDVLPWAVGITAVAAVIGALVAFAPQLLPAGLPVPPIHL